MKISLLVSLRRARLVKVVFASLALASVFALQSVQAQSATWTAAGSGTWTNASNWSTGTTTPGSPTGTTDSDIATFASSGSGTVTLPSYLNLGGITFNGSSAYTISGTGTLVLSNNGQIVLGGSVSQTIAAAVVLEGNASFLDNSTSSSAEYTIGTSSSSAYTISEASGVSGTLTLGGTTANVSNNSYNKVGDLDNGASSGTLTVVKTGPSAVLMTATGGASASNYTGATLIYGGVFGVHDADDKITSTASVTAEGGGAFLLGQNGSSGGSNLLNVNAPLTLGGAYNSLDGPSLNGAFVISDSTGTAYSQTLPSLTIAADTNDIISAVNYNSADAHPILTFTGATPYIRNTAGFVNLQTLNGSQPLSISFTNAPVGSAGNATPSNTNLLVGAYLNGNDFILAQSGTLTAASYYETATGGNTSGNYTSSENVDVNSSQTLDGTISINALRFNTAAETLTLATGTSTISAPGILAGSSSGGSKLEGGAIASANSTGELLVYVHGVTFTIGSVIADNTSASTSTSLSVGAGVTASNSNAGTVTGTLVLTGANTFTGGTSIASGATLQLGDGTTVGTTLASAITNYYGSTFNLDLASGGSLASNITNDGTVNFTSANSQTYSGVISNGASTVGTVNQTGTGTTTITNADTYTGTTTISKGVLQLGNGGTTGALSSSSTIVDTGTLAIDRSNAVTQGTDFSSAAITGAGGLTQLGTGTTTLTAANTYTGKTTVNAGTLQVGNGSGGSIASTSALVLGGGTFVLEGVASAPTSQTVASLATTADTGSVITLNPDGASNSNVTKLTITSATLSTGTLSTLNFNLSGGTTDAATPTLGNTVVAWAPNLTDSIIGGGYTVTDAGGTYYATVSGGDVVGYTGQTALPASGATSGVNYIVNSNTSSSTAGSLSLALSASESANTVTVNTTALSSGAQLSLGADKLTITNGGGFLFTGANPYAITSTTGGITFSASGANMTVNNYATGTVTFSAPILTDAGTNGVAFAGPGTTVLGGANTYTGPTVINSGVVSITGSTVSTGTVVVNGGATLAGTGSTGLVTLNSGGAINLADGVIGKLTIGGLTTTGGGSLTFEIGTGGTSQIDEVADSGALTASGSTTINVANLGGVSQTLTTGTYTILTYTGTPTLGTFTLSGGSTSLDGKNLSLVQSGDNIEIVVTTSTTATTYTLATTAGSTLLHSGATTTLTTTVTNTGTGTADTLNYSGLGASAINGTVSPSTTSGGPLANNSVGTGTNTQTYTAGTAGSDTITPTGSGTNATIGGSATQTGTTTATINVYSGVGVWNTNGGGMWGTVAVTPTNWTANGGTPGITAGFANTDSASFGSVLASGTGSVTLDGENPSLNAITFNDSAASYVIAQGTGTGSITLDGNGGNASVTDLAGSHTISAPINLATSANIDVASGQQLTMSGTISGTGGLVNNGSGTTILSGNNGYSGGTTVSSGTLQLSNGSGSATGSGALSVGAGATLSGSGSSSGSSFSITGNGTAATVLVGHNTASDLNTTGVMSLTASGASSIGSANLVFNLSSNVAHQGNELSVGATAITFNTVGGLNTTLTLNIEGNTFIAGYTSYVLVAGTGTTTMGNTSTPTATTGQYAGLETFVNSKGQDQIITGPTSNLQLKFADPTQAGYYAPSYLFIVDNGSVDDIEVEVVPEPGTWALMLGGLAVLIFIQRSRRKDTFDQK